MAGGNGDTITGGSNGGDYFIAGAGNETLTGGNLVGTDYMFLAGGNDTLRLTGPTAVDTGTGSASIDLTAGTSTVYGGSGGGDLFTAAAGTLDVYGYRNGTDGIGGSVSGLVWNGQSTTVSLSNGASIVLHGVDL